ncbi:hypothetical protein O181_109069 [Austropuccinia psidii MF-1]|uniref:Endonuclease/exonuclease/phosphatase domain-containing protein n=1 Tax=Austropuccinia psidii MF-1 TaxID=1389203 RepID=A0A9Q3JVY9_9BASI|nr:hypothetical protein [Austropuccinia psidii MF-1]
MESNTQTDFATRNINMTQQNKNEDTSSIEWPTETFHTNPKQDFLFFQVNCHDRYDSTISVLNSELTYTSLLLQEPWVNPQNRHRITPTPNPRTKEEKPRSCIYINKQIPSHQIVKHPQEINLLSTITLLGVSNSIPQLTLLSLYNPPTTFSEINILHQFLQTEATRQTWTLLMRDSNFHHPHWNPSKRPN